MSFQPRRISRSAEIVVNAPLNEAFALEAINHDLEPGERKHLH